MLDWLGLARTVKKDGRQVNTCLRDRKTLEMFGYIVRTILQSVVIEAVKVKAGDLKPVDQPIELSAYQKAAETVIKSINLQIR